MPRAVATKNLVRDGSHGLLIAYKSRLSVRILIAPFLSLGVAGSSATEQVECRFDPWQSIALAQRLTRAGINMVEWPQSSGNLSLMGGNLLELITRRQIVAYPDDALRQAILKTVAIENSRGWRLGKTKAADRVDLAIALAMAAIAITQAGRPCGVDLDFQEQAASVFREQSRLRAEHTEAGPGSHSSGGRFPWAIREDGEEARLRSSPRWRLRGF